MPILKVGEIFVRNCSFFIEKKYLVETLERRRYSQISCAGMLHLEGTFSPRVTFCNLKVTFCNLKAFLLFFRILEE